MRRPNAAPSATVVPEELPGHLRDRVLALAADPSAGSAFVVRDLGGGLPLGRPVAICEGGSLDGGLDLWIWTDLYRSELETWRACYFDFATERYAIEDLLVHATRAQDWHAVATCAEALLAMRTHGRTIRKSLGPDGKWRLHVPLQVTLKRAHALVACANAWDTRAERLANARVHDALRPTKGHPSREAL